MPRHYPLHGRIENCAIGNLAVGSLVLLALQNHGKSSLQDISDRWILFLLRNPLVGSGRIRLTATMTSRCATIIRTALVPETSRTLGRRPPKLFPPLVAISDAQALVSATVMHGTSLGGGYGSKQP
jgi:hypothetical protein